MNPRPSKGSSSLSLGALAWARLQEIRAKRARASLERAGSLIPSKPSSLQLEFLALEAEEALFGGAAGAGKSEVLLMGALQHVHVPGYRAGVFRRTKVELQLPDAILNRAHLWFAPALAAGLCRWDDEISTYFFPTGAGKAPAQIHFGYGASAAELHSRYQGAGFHYIAIDELTLWREEAYRYLFGRLRRLEGFPVPMRMRSATNPGGPGHRWVKARFVENARHVLTGGDVRADVRKRRDKSIELPKPRAYVSPPSPEAAELAVSLGRQAQGAHFVPAFLTDNPYLDKVAYRTNLVKLDATRRAQWEWGDWDAEAGGGFFSKASFEIIEARPAGLSWARSWDMAATDPETANAADPDWTVGALEAIFRQPGTGYGRLVVADLERFRADPGPTQTRVVATARLDGRRVPQIFEQEPGAAGKTSVHNWRAVALFGWRVHGMRKTGPKEEYWRPVSGLAQVSPILLVRGAWNNALIAELEDLPAGHDDQADAVCQGYAWFLDGGSARARAAALAAR